MPNYVGLYDGWLAKYGKEEADIRYDRMMKKQKANYKKRAIPNNYDLWVTEYGEEEAKKRQAMANKHVSEALKGHKSLLETWEEQYGEEEAKKRWLEYKQLQKDSAPKKSMMDYWTEQHGEEYAQQRLVEWKKNQSNIQTKRLSTGTNLRGNTFHDYSLPDGNSVRLQGFEPKAYDYLLFKGYKQEDIICTAKNIHKTIGWFCYDGIHNYTPDFYISKENRIIEVKSDYTFKYDTDIHYKKRDYCISLGYKYTFIIISNKEIIEINDN